MHQDVAPPHRAASTLALRSEERPEPLPPFGTRGLSVSLILINPCQEASPCAAAGPRKKTSRWCLKSCGPSRLDQLGEVMLSHGPDKRRLRPLVPLSFRKPHLLALAQIVESVIGDAVAVKVDVAPIAACDEAVVRFGVQFRDRAVRRGLVFLHMAAAPADNILKLAACSFESIAD